MDDGSNDPAGAVSDDVERLFPIRIDQAHPRHRLLSELAEAGIGDVDDALAAEVVHALDIRPHEGVLATYGSIVLAEGQVDLEGWGTRVDFEDLGRLRELADGVTSFVVHSDDGWHLAVGDRPARETDLVALCVQRDARVVRLLPEERVQVLAGEHVWALERAQWKRHPTSAAYVHRLGQRSSRAVERPRIAQGLLDLAVHTLSPGRVGATLVWLPDDDETTGVGGLLAHGGSVPPLPVSQQTTHRAVANLLGQHDGAMLVAPDGRLVCMGVELLGEAGHGLVRHRGMRHRSAARFSHLRPEAIVVVVSGDGPVSVYVGGEDVTGGSATITTEDHPSSTPDGTSP